MRRSGFALKRTRTLSVIVAMFMLAAMLTQCAPPATTPAPAATKAPAAAATTAPAVTAAPAATKAAATTAPAGTAAPAATTAAATTAPAATKAAATIAPAADFNWKQKSGQTLVLYLPEHPWTTAMRPRFPEFEALTGIKLEVQTFAEQQLRDKVLIALQAKSSEFDFWMSLKSREGLKYYRAGYYEPLNKYLDNPSLTPSNYNVKDFGQGPWSGEVFENNVTGIPIIVEGPVIFYRKDLLDAAGLKPPASMDEIATVAEACKKANPSITGVTLRGAPAAVAYTFGPFLRNYGTSWRDSSGKSQLSSPAGLKALETYGNLAKNLGPAGVVTYNFAQSSALFGGGNACLEIESSNELSSILNPQSSKVVGKIGVMPYPPGPGGNIPTVLQWGVSINANSTKKEAAWLFAVWATSPEMQAKLQPLGIASPRASSWETAEWKASLSDPAKAQWAEAVQFVVAKGSGDVGPPAVEQPQARQIVGDMVDAVILGTKSAADAAKEADAALDKLEH